jgi:protein required for attachment to host cells
VNTRQLEEHIRALATLDETESPLISCYVQVGNPFAGFQSVLGERVQTLRRSLEPRVLPAFEDALATIERFLEDGLEDWARGVTLFARGGTQPFFLSLQFRVPVPNWMVVGPTPALYHLVELRDNYDHYAIVLATSTSARILGVNLGSVTEQIWKARPELRTRVGHEWTKDHFQDHRRARTRQFVNDLIHSLERVMAEGGYGHLVLAGNPRVIATIRKALPKHLSAKLIDTVPAAASDQLSDVVASTLQSFLEHEEMDSQAIAEKLVSQIHTQGLAVAGTLNTLRALQNGQADVLVIARDYAPGVAWECRKCHKVNLTPPAAGVCTACHLGFPREFDIREEMVRLAGRDNCGIEVVEHSDVLMNLGGVGCLLHFLAPDTYIHAAA